MRSSWSIASGITVAQRFRGGVQRTFSTHRALVGGCSITIFQSTWRQPYAGLLEGRSRQLEPPFLRGLCNTAETNARRKIEANSRQ